MNTCVCVHKYMCMCAWIHAYTCVSTAHVMNRFVCRYHLSRCMLDTFSGSLGGNMVGRICVCRALGTSDQSPYHWPSLVISWRRKGIYNLWFCLPQQWWSPRPAVPSTKWLQACTWVLAGPLRRHPAPTLLKRGYGCVNPSTTSTAAVTPWLLCIESSRELRRSE